MKLNAPLRFVSITTSQSVLAHPHRKPVAREPGVVHEDVDAREIGEDLLDEFFHGAVVRHIDGVGLGEAGVFGS